MAASTQKRCLCSAQIKNKHDHTIAATQCADAVKPSQPEEGVGQNEPSKCCPCAKEPTSNDNEVINHYDRKDKIPLIEKPAPFCYASQHKDATTLSQQVNEMGPVGPWATGKVDWGPLAGLTGTRPVVDKYSITRFSPAEWKIRNALILKGGDDVRSKSKTYNWNSRQCLEQIQVSVDKTQQDNTRLLNDKSAEVMRWKCELERAAEAATEEIGFLEEQRARLKRATIILQMPESIASECLDRRTGRLDAELVRDELEEELIKEVALCSEIRDLFGRVLDDVEKQLLEDKTAKQRVEFDWSDKRDAHEIDVLCSSLNNRSTVLTFKPGSVIFPERQSSPEYWENWTRESLIEAEATRQRSLTLRATLDSILRKAADDLKAQANRVELALAKTVACNEEVVARLEDDLRKTLGELVAAEGLIDTLENDLRRLDTPLKKAHTRLDKRLARNGVENCRDAVHYGLVDEVKSIAESASGLQGRLCRARQVRGELIEIRTELERELACKRKTIEIDWGRLQKLREHYPSAAALLGH